MIYARSYARGGSVVPDPNEVPRLSELPRNKAVLIPVDKQPRCIDKPANADALRGCIGSSVVTKVPCLAGSTLEKVGFEIWTAEEASEAQPRNTCATKVY